MELQPVSNTSPRMQIEDIPLIVLTLLFRLRHLLLAENNYRIGPRTCIPQHIRQFLRISRERCKVESSYIGRSICINPSHTVNQIIGI
jgi:hypothetical protein